MMRLRIDSSTTGSFVGDAKYPHTPTTPQARPSFRS